MRCKRYGIVGLLLMPILVFAVGCGGGEQQGEQQKPETATKEAAPRTVTEEVTRVVTVEETVAAPEGTAKGTEAETTAKEEAVKQEGSPEETLDLQYQYINAGDYESAYALFDEGSKQAVSVEQYRAFFESNAPYSTTDYSFPSVSVQGEGATVEAAFTVTSASGQERLQRTQQLVREEGQWRVVMRNEQVTAFVGTSSESASGGGLPQDKSGCVPQQRYVPEADGCVAIEGLPAGTDPIVVDPDTGENLGPLSSFVGEPDAQYEAPTDTTGTQAVSCDGFVSAAGNPSQLGAQQFYDSATPEQRAALDADGDGFACDDLETGVDELGSTDDE